MSAEIVTYTGLTNRVFSVTKRHLHLHIGKILSVSC